jgi:hypothetical protein
VPTSVNKASSLYFIPISGVLTLAYRYFFSLLYWNFYIPRPEIYIPRPEIYIPRPEIYIPRPEIKKSIRGK